MSDTSLGQEAAAVTARFPRHTYTLPETTRELESDPSTVTLRQLTIEEEQAALAAAKAKNVDFSYEGAMRSLVAADGKPLTWTGDEVERFFRGLSNKVRDCVVQAFQRLAIPTRKESEDFLASEKIE